jgi:CheY-like chemotaxis protein
MLVNELYHGKYEWPEKKILIVEDDISSAFFLKEVLHDTLAELLFADDGEQAVQMVKENMDIDVVLMDIQLPFKDGYQATREILMVKPGVPVIAQTASAYPHDKDLCLAAGCIDYIVKPINMFELLDKINRVIS